MRTLKSMLIFLLMAASVAYGRTLPVQPLPHSRDLGDAADGISGIVVNQTITQNGYEFYRIFSLLWSENPDSGKYSLYVQERLSKRFGNRIEVYLGQKLMYSEVLPTKYDRLFALCLKAVDETQTNLISLAMQKSDDVDIVREDM